MTHGPLAGVRVLEFSLMYAGPAAGMHLADMGAEVIKVEPLEGEAMRGNAAIVPGHSKGFMWLNRGKKSLAVDLQSPEGQEVIRRLIPTIDVVVINFRPGVPERLKIDYESLRAINPRLIYADITGFGREGPLGGAPASDTVGQAYGGGIGLMGVLDEDGAPVKSDVPFADLPTGMVTALGVCGALYRRQVSGEGQLVSISLLRTVMSLTGAQSMREPISDAHSRDIAVERIREARAAGGSYDALIAARKGNAPTSLQYTLYFNGYRAKDGGIVLGALTKANREALRRVIGMEGDPCDDPGFDARDARNPELLEELKAQLRRRLRERTVSEWMDLFLAAGAPASPANIPEELSDDPQASLHFQEVVHDVTGPQLQVKPVVEMSATPTTIAAGSPLLGGATKELLLCAGYTEEEVRELRSRDVIRLDET
ncbi:MAG: CoA transferase [Dehalococcoidia bacterium]|nr:CoA transferase [Dehalococcoidia bacterium]